MTTTAVVGVRTSPHRLVGETARPYRRQLSAADRVATEAALRMADTVVAVGTGGEAARDAVRSALTMGVDRGVHVQFEPIEPVVGEKYAAVVARAAAREDADLLFVGQAAARMGVEVASLAAETLDWPGLSRVTAIGESDVTADIDEIGRGEIAVQRRLGTGSQEILVVEPPVVLGVDSGFANPRRASLDVAVAGRRKEIEKIPLAAVAPDESRFSMSVGRAMTERVTPNDRWGSGNPPRDNLVEERVYRMLGRDDKESGGTGDMVDAPPKEAAERVVAYLQANDLL